MKYLIPRLNYTVSLLKIFKSLIYNANIERSNVYYYNHARGALYEAIKVTQKTKVGVVAYNCHTVFSSVASANCEICFIDITHDLKIDMNDLKLKSKNIEVLVITHLFGITNDVLAIKAQFPNIIIVEDCAHAMGSCCAGKFGDFAVFSIGSAKCPSIGEGGILKVNNIQFNDSIRNSYINLIGYETIQSFKLLIKILVMALLHNKYLYKYFTLPYLKTKRSKVCIRPSQSKKMCRLILNYFQLVMVNFDSKIVKQRDNGFRLINIIQHKKGIYIPESLRNFDENNMFMLPILIADRMNLVEFCSNNGVEVGSHFSESIEWAKEFGYVTNDCPNCEYLSSKIVTIPTHYGLSKGEISKIENVLTKFCN